MNKHTVFFLGKKTYFVETEEEAVELADKDIKYMHPSFNLEISEVRYDDN